VLGLVERDIDRSGQQLIAPEVVLDGWATKLIAEQFNADKIMAPYADHGTYGQFHSKFKTDLDLERLPSGKFDINSSVCQVAALAMDILSLTGQRGLLGQDAPVRHRDRRQPHAMEEDDHHPPPPPQIPQPPGRHRPDAEHHERPHRVRHQVFPPPHPEIHRDRPHRGGKDQQEQVIQRVGDVEQEGG
jgi:hypothetical protein